MSDLEMEYDVKAETSEDIRALDLCERTTKSNGNSKNRWKVVECTIATAESGRRLDGETNNLLQLEKKEIHLS